MTLAILLIPYGLFLIITTVFFLFNFYHILRFGLQSFKTTLVLIIYIALFGGSVVFTFSIMNTVDWNQQIDTDAFFESNILNTDPV